MFGDYYHHQREESNYELKSLLDKKSMLSIIEM